MKKSDINTITLVGTVKSAKAWDPKPGKQFTNGNVEMMVGSDTIHASFYLKMDGENNHKKVFETLFVTGRSVILYDAGFGSYLKADKLVPQVTGNLFTCGITDGSSFNACIVSGNVTTKAKGPNNSSALLVESCYDGKTSSPRWKSRTVKVLDQQNTEVSVGDRIMVTGSCREGQTGPYLEATSIYPIRG